MRDQIGFSPKEFAGRYEVSAATVYRWIASGRLGSIKVGRCRRITLSHEAEFLEKHQDRASEQHGQELQSG